MASASFAPLRHRSFALALGSNFISSTGTWMQSVALGIYLTVTTKNAAWLGLLTAAAWLPALIGSPLGGVMADRYSRQRWIQMNNLTQAAAAGALAILELTHHLSAPLACYLAIAEGFCSSASWAAWQSLLPDLVDHDEVLAAGGLHIIGTERHESRRIDNQLRGRSGRQGDPGRSKFFLSLEDDLMRIFGSDRLDSMLTRLGLKEGEAIIHPWINKALEKAQQKVEARNFDIRKNLLKFDNVQNDQRKVIFDQRVELMKSENVADMVADMRRDFVDEVVAKHVPEHAYAEQWDIPGLREELKRVLDIDLPVDEWAKEEGIADEELLTRIEQRVDEHMAAKVAQWGPDVMRYVEKTILLQTLDHLWREHLIMLDHLRQVIGLRGYGQRDPLQEYKSEAFALYEAMTAHLREAVTAQLMRVEIVPPEEQAPVLPPMEAHKLDPNTGEDEMAFAGASLVPAAAADRDPKNPASWGKVGRNEDCPCGSGKKYKHCHGKYA